jgi:hypothetical protein
MTEVTRCRACHHAKYVDKLCPWCASVSETAKTAERIVHIYKPLPAIRAYTPPEPEIAEDMTDWRLELRKEATACFGRNINQATRPLRKSLYVHTGMSKPQSATFVYRWVMLGNKEAWRYMQKISGGKFTNSKVTKALDLATHYELEKEGERR